MGNLCALYDPIFNSNYDNTISVYQSCRVFVIALFVDSEIAANSDHLIINLIANREKFQSFSGIKENSKTSNNHWGNATPRGTEKTRLNIRLNSHKRRCFFSSSCFFLILFLCSFGCRAAFIFPSFRADVRPCALYSHSFFTAIACISETAIHSRSFSPFRRLVFPDVCWLLVL